MFAGLCMNDAVGSAQRQGAVVFKPFHFCAGDANVPAAADLNLLSSSQHERGRKLTHKKGISGIWKGDAKGSESSTEE